MISIQGILITEYPSCDIAITFLCILENDWPSPLRQCSKVLPHWRSLNTSILHDPGRLCFFVFVIRCVVRYRDYRSNHCYIFVVLSGRFIDFLCCSPLTMLYFDVCNGLSLPTICKIYIKRLLREKSCVLVRCIFFSNHRNILNTVTRCLMFLLIVMFTSIPTWENFHQRMVAYVPCGTVKGLSVRQTMSSSKTTSLIVFDLDYTLWPFWVDTHVQPPFCRRGSQIVDAHGCRVRVYAESDSLLSSLHQQGYQMAVASRTSEINGAKQLLQLLDWQKYFQYTEIYPGCKREHFARLRRASGFGYDEMLFFDDEQRNIDDLRSVGVRSVLVNDGVTRHLVQQALDTFSS